MKNLLLSVICLLFSTVMYAQVPTPLIADGQTMCVGESHYYGDQVVNPTSVYTFAISNGQAFTVVGQQINVTWTTIGTYVITMTETNASGCQVIVTATINVFPAGIAVLNPISVCQDGNTQTITGLNLGVNPVYAGTGVTGNQINPAGILPGVYNFTVTSTTANGCPITGAGVFTVNPLPTGIIYTD